MEIGKNRYVRRIIMTAGSGWRNGLMMVLVCLPLSVQAVSVQDLELLDRALQMRNEYEAQKRESIRSIMDADMATYDRYLALTEEYQSYSYDTATLYVEKMADEATTLEDEQKITAANIKRAFLFLSSGLFKESADVFEDMDISGLTPDLRAEYHIHYARLLYDMADYVHGQISAEYLTMGHCQSEQALSYIPHNDTVRYWSTAALYASKQDDYQLAVERFERALECSTITEHERAIAYSSMGFAYDCEGKQDLADHYWILAAIADLKSCTKETMAMSIVAQRMYQYGDIEHATRYIQQALADAQFYNARHRQLHVSKILPIIEQHQLLTQQKQNRRIRVLNVCLYAMIAAMLVMLFFLYNRIKRTIAAERRMEEMNRRLREANYIKEECIATFLYNESSVYSKLERYQRYVKKRAQEKRWEELLQIPSYADVRTLRNDFYKRFDSMFLHIFPNFIAQFNALLDDDKQIRLRVGELLNTELRIFALIRLGINDNQQIATLLDYSINTIYTYKTKVKSYSQLSSEEFYQRLMQIAG